MSLILHYKFNDPASLTEDSSGNSEHLTVVGSTIGSVVDATYGSVVDFVNSTDSYFSLASAPVAINSEGVFDISNFEGDVLEEHMNTLFETGDQVVRSVNNEPVTTTFVKDGGNYAEFEPGVFSFAFSASGGTGQMASLGDVDISFDEVNDSVIIDGVSYTDGESFAINGKIVTVYNA